jgi:glutaredoxin-like protein NrdH
VTHTNQKPTITVYGKEDCYQCRFTEKSFADRGVPIVEDDITTDENTALARSLGHQRAPLVTVVIDGKVVDHWSGLQPNKIAEYASQKVAA